ncbi:MAG TPA: glycosyltransferase family 39 protein, partial [Xanthomonadales bacterium]|nr:glycosyltransferase family 39 protein [Xanthomonadales bacterium]
MAILLMAAMWLVYGAFFAPAGLFTDDEIIHSAMIDRFATSGSFVIPNGYEDFPTESLRLTFLVPGPHGLVPQYPEGYAILAAPFYLLGGMQGIVFLNTLASVLTLFLTWRMARILFGDERLAASAALIFGLATFAVDYAFAIWPHAVGNAFVAGALYAAVSGLEDEDESWRSFMLAGLLIGLGVSIRRDVLIAAPLIGVWLFLFARRPIRATGAFAVPLGLGLMVAAWLNYLKFGDFNPVTYGHSAGDGQMTGVLRYAPYALLAGGLLLLMRWRPAWHALRGRRGWAAFAFGVALILALPATRNLALRVFDGLWVLLVNIEHTANLATHPRYQAVGDSHYLYFGTLKKTLVESLPYLPLLLFPLAGLLRGPRRAAHALCLFFPVCWFLVYAPTQLIGGLANNMRYL